MAVRLKADGTTGKVAIYTGTDDLPFTSPLSYVSRLRFHSDLEYPKIIDTQTGSLTLSALSANVENLQTHTLFAHGRGGTPFVEGFVTISGTRVPLTGSTPVDFGSTDPTNGASGFCRFLHLGADATNVMIREYSLTSYAAAPGPVVTFSSLALTWTVYVLDTLF